MEWLGVIVGVLLVGFGIWGTTWAVNPYLHALAEPAFVAGIVTITVDPFLKRRLLRETSKDIFSHMIGFGLPQEIQHRIKEIALGTNLYRKNMEMSYTFERREHDMYIECDYQFDVINPSNQSMPYSQRMEFEKLEHATLLSVSCSLLGDDYGKDARLHQRTSDELFTWEGPAVNIPPASSGIATRFRGQFSIVRPPSDFHFQHFAHPTIGLTLRIVKRPDNLRVSGTPADPPIREKEWIYQRLYMPGQHIQMRWEETPIPPPR